MDTLKSGKKIKCRPKEKTCADQGERGLSPSLARETLTLDFRNLREGACDFAHPVCNNLLCHPWEIKTDNCFLGSIQLMDHICDHLDSLSVEGRFLSLSLSVPVSLSHSFLSAFQINN